MVLFSTYIFQMLYFSMHLSVSFLCPRPNDDFGRLRFLNL